MNNSARSLRVRGLTVLPWLVSLAILLILPEFVHSESAFTIMNLMAINVVFALSYNMLLGQSGLLSFGQAVFFGFGGYAAVHAMNAIGGTAGFWTHFPVVGLPLVGFVTGGIAAAIVGWPFVRNAGLAFAMITLGLGVLVDTVAQSLQPFFGGIAGVFSDRTVGPVWFGLKLDHASDVFWFMVFWVFVATIAMWAFTRTPLGRMCNAVRDNAERVRFLGYRPHTIRFLVFVASGAFAGLAGGMSAVNFEVVTPSALGLTPSGLVLMMVAVGGAGVFYGPIVGAIIVTFMNSALTNYTRASVLYLGLVFLAVVMFAPSGLSGGVEQVRSAWSRGTLRQSLPVWLGRFAKSLLFTCGLVTLVELVYQLRHGQDTLAKSAGISFDPHAPWGWIAALALFAAAYGAHRLARKYLEVRE
ncbi:MAG: branched-chain amino acid ABC transporter permease [Rhodanobacteraceae bacterium]